MKILSDFFARNNIIIIVKPLDRLAVLVIDNCKGAVLYILLIFLNACLQNANIMLQVILQFS